ncbi:MAG TPA: peptidoglycan-binding domain-containing protein, partial [Thermoanaerobaculia bacterium]
MKRFLAVAMAVAVLGACSREQVQQKAKTVTAKVKDAADDVAVPFGGKRDDAASRERERFDQHWRQLVSFRAQQQAAAKQQAEAQQRATAPPPAPPANFQFVSNKKESFKGLDADGINNAPVVVPITGDIRGPSVLRAQVYLDRIHFAVGTIDGRWGRNSGITVWWYQRARGLEPTG